MKILGFARGLSRNDRSNRCVVIGALTVFLTAGLVLAQNTPRQIEPSNDGHAEQQNAEQQAEREDAREPFADPPPEAVPDKNLPGPKYNNLRFNDDFSYLDGEPGSYREDVFDPIKNIRLDENWRLSLGGEFRFQMESHTNLAFGARPRTQDTFQLYRNLLHFDLKYRDSARFFLQVGSMLVSSRSLPPRAIDENRFTFQQFFFDLKPFGDNTPMTVRIGRQDLQYGKQRFISPLDWSNTRRRFDAVKVFWREDNFDLDFFYSKPTVVDKQRLDRWNEEVDFYGAYFSYKAIPRHTIDAFFFGQDDTRDRTNPNGNSGDMSRYTLGATLIGKTGDFDYNGFVAGQWGRWAGDTIQAWAWGVEAGYTLSDVAWKPRIGTGFDWASGDEDPLDGKVGTFDQLFPLGHAYLGFLDLIGRQNINAFHFDLTAWPIPKKVKAKIAYHAFWLNAKRDALYNAGGAPGRRDTTGASGTEVGHEVDLTVVWKIDPHQSMLFGYSHFWDSTFITNTGASDDPDMLYVRYSFKF
ncbi:MAG: alginate export family protein [Planctomycetes bacterium]|nr:alginate export family protein [Planctomycetota bacterium]